MTIDLISPGNSAICLLSISNKNAFAIDYKVMTTAPKVRQLTLDLDN